MNIGFDLDGVFIGNPPGIPSEVIEWAYKGHLEGMLAYRIPGKFEQKIRILSHYPFLRPGIQENIAMLPYFKKKQKHNFFLVSSRFNFLHKQTNDIVAKYHFDKFFKGMYFNNQNDQPHHFKNAMIKKLRIQTFVDDDLPLLQFLAKLHPDKTFYWLNKSVAKKNGTNIFAITKLSQINI